MLIPHPLPPVFVMNIKTKELDRSNLASISKQRTYKSFVLILLYALRKEAKTDPSSPQFVRDAKFAFEADRPSLRFRVALVVYVSQLNFGT
jgi:hypothetical protein